MSTLSRRVGIAMALIASLAWAWPSSAGVLGTRPNGRAFHRAPGTGTSSGLRAIVSEVGRIGVSIDGAGTVEASSVVQVEKPAGATVRRAFLVAATAGFSGHSLADGDITVDGADVTWDTETATDFDSRNYFTEVTSLVAAKIDAAPAGRVDFTIGEASPVDIDGVALVVVFDDSAQPRDATVVLFFGAQPADGGQFSLGLASPVNAGDPNLRFDLSLGIAFGFQSPQVTDQVNIIDVNGSRLTSSAGGQDDGTGAAGSLFTIGGLDDSPANPAPFSPPLDYDTDDERYDLVPFLATGDMRVIVETSNPSDDDNLFFACVTTSEAIREDEALILTPVHSTGEVGTALAVTATLEDALGEGVPGTDVAFEIFAGPHAGATHTGVTDSDGRAHFSYSGSATGTDSIRAIAAGGSGEVRSNVAVRVWTEAGTTDSYALLLKPLNSTGSAGLPHTLDATLTNDGAPEPGRRIVFEVFAGPSVGYRDSADTNVDGVATVAYTSHDVGVDSILARTTVGAAPPISVFSNRVARTWTSDGGGEDSVALTLEPVSATGAIGATHTVTATLTVHGAPREGTPVSFTVFGGPHVGAVGTDTTDVDGHAVFAYAGVQTGVDSIIATVQVGAAADSSNTVTVRWTDGGTQTYTLALAPAMATRPLGAQHAVTAVAQANGVGLADARIEFSVLGGPHAGVNGVDSTDVSGAATFRYTGSTVGVDTVRAASILDGQAVVSNTVMVTWFDDDNPGGFTVVGLDVKPTSCVNPVNTGSKGVTPVSLLGGPNVDVRDIDVSSLRLEGVAPLRRGYGDVSRPGPDEECGCSSEGPDGHRDLNLKFDTQAFVAALGAVTDREIRTVTLTGRFKDDTPLVATDCIRIIDRSGHDGGGDEGDEELESGVAANRPVLELDPVKPNPFNPATSMTYRLPREGHVRLTVFDVRGRVVATLVDAVQAAGEHSVRWVPGSLASGVYFSCLESGGRTIVQRGVLAK